MTKEEIPSQVSTLLREIGSPSSCCSSTIERLRALLLPSSLAILKSQESKDVARQRSKITSAEPQGRANINNKKRRAAPTGVAPKTEVGDAISLQARLSLATEVVNKTLKFLNEQLKDQKSLSSKLAKCKKTSTNTLASRDPSAYNQSPLREICVNIAHQSPRRGDPNRNESSAGQSSDACRTQAECGRIALACLRSLQSSKSLQAKFTPLQLETAMSALVSKMLALNLNDLALKEIRILKHRLDIYGSQSRPVSAKVAKDAQSAPQRNEKESLSDLLRYDCKDLPNDILPLIVSTQIYVLRLIKAKDSGSACEASLKHLQLEIEYSPAILLERYGSCSSDKALQDLSSRWGSLIGAVQGLLFVRGSTKDGLSTESMGLSPAAIFGFQTLLLRLKLRWWAISHHNPDLEHEVTAVLSRSMSKFRQDYSLDNVSCYDILYSAYTDVALDVNSLLKITDFHSPMAHMVLADRATKARRFDHAVKWLQAGLESLDDHEIPSAWRPSFLCRLLCVYFQDVDLRRELQIICRHTEEVIAYLKGTLHGESEPLDELFVSVTELMKQAFSFLQEHPKDLACEDEAGEASVSSQIVTVILSCAHFALRYTGNSPPTDATGHRLSRYRRRKDASIQAAPAMIQTLMGVAKLSLRHKETAWVKISRGLEDGLQLCSLLYRDDTEDPPREGRNLYATICTSLSQIYWARHQFSDTAGEKAVKYTTWLEKSIELLRNVPIANQAAGHMPHKLEKLASYHESVHDYEKSQAYCQDALRYFISAGVTRQAADEILRLPISNNWETRCEIDHLNRFILLYMRVGVKLRKRNGQNSLLFLDADSISSPELGVLQILHLRCVISMVQKPEPHGLDLFDTEKLTSSLLEIYTKNYRVRRLELIASLFHLASIQPKLLSENTKSILNEEARSFESASSDGLDDLSKSCVSHLQACCSAYAALLSESTNLAEVRIPLKEWRLLLKKRSGMDFPFLSSYGVQLWLSLLDLLKDSLAIRGSDFQRVSVLEIAAAVHHIFVLKKCDRLASILMDICLQYLRLGYSTRAALALNKARDIANNKDFPLDLLIKWHLVKAEYALECGDLECSKENAAQARGLSETKTRDDLQATKFDLQYRLAKIVLNADACVVESRLASEQGEINNAMLFARISVQSYHRIWSLIERQLSVKTPSRKQVHSGSLTDSMEKLSLSAAKGSSNDESRYSVSKSPFLWNMLPRLFTSLHQLALLYGKCGMSPEAHYYVGESEKIVSAIRSENFTSSQRALEGQLLVSCGERSQGLERLEQAEHSLSRLPTELQVLRLHESLAASRLKTGCADQSLETALKCLDGLEILSRPDNLEEMSYLAERNQDQGGSCTTAGRSKDTAKRVKAGTVSKVTSNTRKKNAAAAAALDTLKTLASVDAIPLEFSKRDLKALLASTKFAQGQVEHAQNELWGLEILSSRWQEIITIRTLSAEIDFNSLMMELASDAVLSTIAESSICYPATSGPLRSANLSLSPVKPSRPGKGARNAVKKQERHRPGTQASELDLRPLQAAYHRLQSIYELAGRLSTTATLHAISRILCKVSVLISTLSPDLIVSPSSYSPQSLLEAPRMCAMERERAVIGVETRMSHRQDIQDWPIAFDDDASDVDQGIVFDSAQFSAKYLSIIPKSWLVISMTLSEKRDEVWMSRMRSGNTSFVLKLPFRRENATDCGEETFSFDQAKAEIAEIVELANESAHKSDDMSRKGAKTEWWQTRTSLDTRLKDLLTNIENVWFGGFRGVFSQHEPDPELLARFQQSFLIILNKHLPSRQRVAKGHHGPPAILDIEVLSLFIALGDPHEIGDLDDEILDLLYFVVDILQFNGERNAYDEIDFDAMIVDLLDALHQYHQALSSSSGSQEYNHLILILDKNLHCFPWESLPVLDQRSVSRLPSLACLRRRILSMNASETETARPSKIEGIAAAIDKGAFILNPSNDLSNTQKAFEEPLANLQGWDSIIQREPEEAEVRAMLEREDVFLYFGHGSGGQYIRPRTVKKLKTCATTLLMGCSSGVLTERGEFESCGTPINYMHAGCPALVATLWDVTDKDIDRYSTQVLRKWGLLQNEDEASQPKGGSERKGKSKVKKVMRKREASPNPEPKGQQMSLNEAVATSRGTCFLRYLNGAAPVVYGVPVYLI